MPPTIVLVRHAQALHNMTQDFALRDPPLSDLGIQQCTALRESLLARFPSPPSVAIIASPLRRTLQTALLSVDWLLSKTPVEADPEWQENSDYPCDTGSALDTLRAEFADKNITWAGVRGCWPESWPEKRDRYAHTRAAILERGKRVLERLSERPEELVIVFSHAAFLRLGVSGWCFFNADYRVFEMVRERDGGEEEVVYGELGVGEGREWRLRQGEDTRQGGMGLSGSVRVMLGSGLPDVDGTLN